MSINIEGGSPPRPRLRPVAFARESDLEETNANLDGVHAKVLDLTDDMTVFDRALAAVIEDVAFIKEALGLVEAEASEPEGEFEEPEVINPDDLDENFSDDGIEETPEEEAERLRREAEEANEEPALADANDVVDVPEEGVLVREAVDQLDVDRD